MSDYDDYADEYARGYNDGCDGYYDRSGDWEYKRGHRDAVSDGSDTSNHA